MSSAAANQQAMARDLAAMQSMKYNQAAQLRGLQQQAIYRTQDNLEGVYWHMYFADHAQARSVYSHIGSSNMIPSPLVQHQAVVDWQRRQAIAVRNQLELNRRLQQRISSVRPQRPAVQTSPRRSPAPTCLAAASPCRRIPPGRGQRPIRTASRGSR